MSAELIRSLLARPVAFHPSLARLVGSAGAGLFLSQLLYWSDNRSSHPDGWIYKDSNEWMRETTLSADELRGAKKIVINRGIVECEPASKHFPKIFTKFDKTLCYRINFECLSELLKEENRLETREVVEGRNFPLRESEIPNPDLGISQSGPRNFPSQYTESTTETTTTLPLPPAPPLEELIEAAYWQATQKGRVNGMWFENMTKRITAKKNKGDVETWKSWKAEMEKQNRGSPEILRTELITSSAAGDEFLMRTKRQSAAKKQGLAAP